MTEHLCERLYRFMLQKPQSLTFKIFLFSDQSDILKAYVGIMVGKFLLS